MNTSTNESQKKVGRSGSPLPNRPPRFEQSAAIQGQRQQSGGGHPPPTQHRPRFDNSSLNDQRHSHDAQVTQNRAGGRHGPPSYPRSARKRPPKHRLHQNSSANPKHGERIDRRGYQNQKQSSFNQKDGHGERKPASLSPPDSRPIKRIKLEDSPHGSDNQGETHILFVIDFSGSMREKDVRKGRQRVSRWDAVFECMQTVITDQVRQQSGSAAVISLVSFNEDAHTLLDCVPLAGGGKVLDALEKTRKKYVPYGGTSFSAGFERAKVLATAHAAKKPSARNQTMLIFLSDGRPGDLCRTPPESSQSMQTTFQRNQRKHPAAGVHIQEMQRKHGDRLNLQLICIHNGGTKVCILLFGTIY